MVEKTRVAVGLTVMASAIALGLAACGASAGSSNAPAAGGATPGAEANAGEAPAVAYVDSRYHYRIDGPGRMTVMADGTAAYEGHSERLKVAVVEGARAADLNALARDDVTAFAASTTTFHLTSGPSTISLNGHRVVKFVYTYSAGTSPVTGKPLTLVGVRYYVPKDAATAAEITYGIVSNQYDPQGADDVAGTFQWL